MLKRTIPLIAIVLCVLIARTLAQTAHPKLQSTAQKLFASLSEEQKKLALLPFDSRERNKIRYEGGKRPGIHIKDLTPEQQKLAEELLTQFTSPYGKEKSIAIADQPSNTNDPTTGFTRYYVAFFGDPTADKDYAWRIAEHHLTIVHVEVADGKLTSFGPILLGANPPNLWDAEEGKMIALYSVMTPEERAKSANQGKANSSEFAKPGTKSIRLGDLSQTAKQAALEVLNHRLTFFADEIQQRIREQLTTSGGEDTLQLAFYGAAEKKCREGGRWDFKLFNDKFLCDYENTRAHIHFSLRTSEK
jgi:hypothetical protein